MDIVEALVIFRGMDHSLSNYYANLFGIIAGSLESANSSILAACRLFKQVVGEKIRILC